MHEIMCFGDSNTWGYDPKTGQRYERDIRWTGVMQKALGDEYRVIEEGLNGRTTVWEDPIEGDKNGRRHLPVCLESHKPLDLIVVMLGTNDLKMRYSAHASDIARGAGVLIDIIRKSDAGRQGKAPKVLLIAPPPVARLTELAGMFEGAGEKSKAMGRLFAEIASQLGCPFLDASAVIRSSDRDGIHLEEKDHAALGQAVAREARTILG